MIPNLIKDIINNSSMIALAVSGGSDSMAMLHWFISNIDKSKFYVVNVEHGIRGDESLKDSLFVSDFCKKSGVKCVCHSVNATEFAISNKLPLEQAARILRHEIFKSEAVATADYIALAHHKADQAESIFMHIARGCGINGLCGMNAIDGYIIRPLLSLEKAEIMEYIKTNNIPYANDSTNNDNAYSRNYTRNVIMPTVEKVYPQFNSSLIKLGEHASEAMEFICSLLPKLAAIDGCCTIDINALPKVVAKVAIQRAAALVGVGVDIEEKHISALLNLTNQNNGARLKLPHNITAYNEDGLLCLTVKPESDDSIRPFAVGEHNFVYGDLYLAKSHGNAPVTCLMDYNKIPSDAVIRSARVGDKIKLSYGSKSLGDYYTDKKVPKRLRGCLPVIASGNIIIAIADWAVGIDYAPTPLTTQFIEIKYILKDEIYD